MTEYRVMAEEQITMMNIGEFIEYLKRLRAMGVKRVSGKVTYWKERNEGAVVPTLSFH